MTLPRALLVLCMTLLSAAPAAAQEVEAGREIAQRWCSGCHSVAPGAMRDATPPSFAMIAARKDINETAIAAFLAKPHGRMPDLSLTRREIRDLSAYILSLKP